MICKFNWIVISVFLFSTFMVEPAFAVGSMRCGKHIISSGGRHGPDKYEVLKKCGEPTTRQGDTWIYELTGSATRVVVFDASGNLARIS